MSGFSKKEIGLLFGLAIVLFSIPLAMVLVKQSQIFNSAAKGPTPVTKITPLPTPDTSSLTDLKNLLGASISATPSPGVVVSFGPTLTIDVQVQGRSPNKNAESKVFVGVAPGDISSNPSYLLSFSIDLPDSGKFSGLSLAGLSTGNTYTVYIKGPAQIATASAFIVNPRENVPNNGQPLLMKTGDLNEDNVIDKKDLDIAKLALGSTAKSSNWNSRADFNLDGIVNNIDLSLIYNNMNQIGASGQWFSTPLATDSANPTVSAN
ncbi:hypothetical protein M1563_05175 [Patescibacteria group bacterium]|nr:hypothetical protein [Patescibacteria group bacterium]